MQSELGKNQTKVLLYTRGRNLRLEQQSGEKRLTCHDLKLSLHVAYM
jgi:hypothetical protein